MRPVADEDPADAVAELIELGRDREAAKRGASHGRHGAAMDPLTQFDRLGEPLGTVIAGISADQLDRPTPCADFTVRGVLEHMVGGATMFAAAYRGEASVEPDMSDVLGAIGPTLQDLGAALNAPGALDATIAAPFGEVPGDAFARFVVLDGLVHGWDLAQATGQPYDPPADLVGEADAFARGQLDALRDGQTFAAAVEPPAGATPIERLVAYTGRRP
jgi:uncharacterized protein (TIGR03086 family)